MKRRKIKLLLGAYVLVLIGVVLLMAKILGGLDSPAKLEMCGSWVLIAACALAFFFKKPPLD